MRVLLVEDEARIAHFVAKGLRERSYAVDVVSSGEQALYQAAISSYDLVILDVMIPLLMDFRFAGNSATPGRQCRY